jgi:chromosome partitioning protein
MTGLTRDADPRRHGGRGMKTLAVVALKGGTGKTTVCVNLAASAHLAGLRVLLADMDPQGSALDWGKSRQAPGPVVTPLKVGSLFPAQYTAQNAKYDLMLLDTRASAPPDAAAAVNSADLSLIVVRPTVIDLRAIAATVELVRPLRRPAVFVINQAPSQRVGRDPVIVMEAIELLMSYGLPVAPVGLRARQIYQTAFSQGRSPLEDEPASSAGEEIGRLWRFAAERLWPLAPSSPAPSATGRKDSPLSTKPLSDKGRTDVRASIGV